MKSDTSAKLDPSKLLGFDAMADLNGMPIDFRQKDIAARLGAKVGEPTVPSRDGAR